MLSIFCLIRKYGKKGGKAQSFTPLSIGLCWRTDVKNGFTLSDIRCGAGIYCLCQWKGHGKKSAGIGVVGFDAAIVIQEDSVDDGQAESGAMAFGSKKWIENLR